MTIPLLAAVLDPPTPEKAYLVAETNFKEKLELQFNPETLQISRSVNWSSATVASNRAYKALSYGGSGYDTMSVRIIIDTSMPKDPFGLKAAATQAALAVPGVSPNSLMDLLMKTDPDSVLDTIDKLVEWTYPSVEGLPSTVSEGVAGTLSRPPAIAFMWGSEIKFFGAIQKLDFKLTLFDSDGTPVRAEGNITLVGRREGPSGSELGYLHELFHEKADKAKTPDKSTGKTSDAEKNIFGL